jgi:hypothetical protein
MHADARKLLWDAQQAALRVQSYTREFKTSLEPLVAALSRLLGDE